MPRHLLASLLLALPLAAQGVDLQPQAGDPLPGLTPLELQRFFVGRAVFDTPLPIAQGLGPIMNQTSCGACHNGGGVGGAGTIFVTRFGVAATGSSPFDPLARLGGSLLQAQAISIGCEEQIPPQANVVANRMTTPTFGIGLIEAIPDSALLALAQNPPPGVSGIAHMVPAFEDPPMSPLRVGRFGWKAQVATVLTFSADASLNELGLTNRFLTVENAPNGNLVLLQACDQVPDPEDGPDSQGFHRIDRMTDFQRFLAPPPQTPRSGMQGEAVFAQIGCAACHVPSHTTGPAPEAALAFRTIRPYSDFLLHDMGSLGDGIVQGQGTETEMRTPPLWGLRLRDTFLHDGRSAGGGFAANVHHAILQHDGEGAAARSAYLALGAADKAALIRFLDSLGRHEFDQDGDNQVTDLDWFFIEPLRTGPVATYTPESWAAVSDVDQDGDIDLVDIALYQRAMSR
jgi:CxxC motif-containing protein (DUF1111 family)